MKPTRTHVFMYMVIAIALVLLMFWSTCVEGLATATTPPATMSGLKNPGLYSAKICNWGGKCTPITPGLWKTSMTCAQIGALSFRMSPGGQDQAMGIEVVTIGNVGTNESLVGGFVVSGNGINGKGGNKDKSFTTNDMMSSFSYVNMSGLIQYLPGANGCGDCGGVDGIPYAQYVYNKVHFYFVDLAIFYKNACYQPLASCKVLPFGYYDVPIGMDIKSICIPPDTYLEFRDAKGTVIQKYDSCQEKIDLKNTAYSVVVFGSKDDPISNPTPPPPPPTTPPPPPPPDISFNAVALNFESLKRTDTLSTPKPTIAAWNPDVYTPSTRTGSNSVYVGQGL